LTQAEKIAATQAAPPLRSHADLPDSFEIGRPSADRARIASEIGAAMAHELNGPMTALLLYVGDIRQHGRFADADGDGHSLERVVENAYREAERICQLIHRMGDFFETPAEEEMTVAAGRDAIGWWSRRRAAGGKADAGGPALDGRGRAGEKPLTQRELEVLRLVSEGYSNKEGAIQMNISHRTFECHRAEVMRKLGARNTADLVRLALLGIAATSISPQPDAR
jgi:DNA-binding CsgD family transcriptional regulator